MLPFWAIDMLTYHWLIYNSFFVLERMYRFILFVIFQLTMVKKGRRARMNLAAGSLHIYAQHFWTLIYKIHMKSSISCHVKSSFSLIIRSIISWVGTGQCGYKNWMKDHFLYIGCVYCLGSRWREIKYGRGIVKKGLMKVTNEC